MANIGYVSTLNVNGNELTIKDTALTEVVNEIIEAIGANNGDISERINNLHDRSFDALIKIESANESEIASIQDGMYKLQYVTVTGSGDDAVETLNDSAILIQQGTNQYLYKDGQLSSRVKTDSTWGTWVIDNHPVTSVNGMTGAVTLDIPSEIITGQIVGRMHRDNVSGTGNLTITGASGEGFNPNGITTAGEYIVVVYSWSETKTFGYNISFGDNNYTLSTTDGTISDKRELTVSAGALWSGSVTVSVSSGTTIIVEIYKAEKITPVLSVGTVALTNLYNDLDGKPTISSSTSSTSTTDIASSRAVKLAYDHGGVQSVNGMTGAVTIAIPEGQLSNNYATATGTNSDLLLASGDTYEQAFGKLEKEILDNELITAAGMNDLNDQIANIIHPVSSVNGMTGAVVLNIPVTSVNGMTGAVTVDVPVTSVNGMTGAVTITETQLSKGTATGAGNAVTDINVSNHQITLVKGATYATQSDIDTSIANLVDSAPETLNTLNELAEALGNDENFATTVATQIGQKYTKPSTGIPASDLADGVILQSDWRQTDTTANDYIKNKPDIYTSGPDTYINSGYIHLNSNAIYLPTYTYIGNNLYESPGITSIDVNGTPAHIISKIAYIDIPTKTSELTNDSGFITNAPVQSVNGMTGAVTIDVGVTSFNGQTGAVTLALGQTNVIETVKVNNTALTPDANKAVNITVPTKITTDFDTTYIEGNPAVVIHDGNHDNAWVSGRIIIDPAGSIDIISLNDLDLIVPTGSKVTYNSKEIATVDQIITPPVTSVNGMTGAVTINVGVTSFNGATGAVTYTPPVTSVNGMTGAITVDVPVTSVNGQTGAVTVKANVQADWDATSGDAVILNKPDLTTYENKVTSVNGQTGAVSINVGVTSFNGSTGAVTYTAPVTSVNGQTGAVTINHPVTSVNGMTGAVTIETGGVTSFNGATGAITYTAPVTSVNGMTGAVTITIPESQLSNDYTPSTASNNALNLASGDTYETAFGKLEKSVNDKSLTINTSINELNGRINNLSDVSFSGDYDDLLNKPTITYPVISVNGMTGAVNINVGVTSFNGSTGAVTYTAPVTSVNGMTGAVTVDVGVTSFNGATGAVTYTPPVTSVNGSTGAVTVKENVQSDWNATTGDAVILNKPTIPDAVTESTVAGWGFTKNTGTLTTETQLSKGTATGTGNAVTDINVSNHQITLVKGATYATQEDINESISNLVNSAPTTLDTLNELATALGNDPNFAITVATQIGQKYTKPSTGIPASDLAAGVIPTVPVQSVNGMTGAVTINTGVTSFNGSTGAVTYTAPVASVNGQTGAVNLIIPTVNDSTVTLTMNGNTVGTFTLNKSGNTTIDLGTVLTSHQSIKTVNNESLVGTGNISINGLPTVTSSDNGKVLMVVDGAWTLVSPVSLYSGSGTPSNSQGNNGDIYVQS